MRKVKQQIIDAYGGKCTCCGETIVEFLTIDVKRNGAKFHKLVGYGGDMYLWLRRHNFPKRNFQLLCFNCNCAKGLFGKCPHKLDKHK